ncbi:MAG: peroxide stress protein YaaA, partial [Bacteroidota bacterium]
AKKLDFESENPFKNYSQPAFLKESEQLIKELRKRSKSELKEMMGISENLAELNRQRYQNWQTPFTPQNSRQALLAFDGDVYKSLQAKGLSKNDLSFAQKHLFILSGLYGMLRPMDLIQPYRLEMGSKFQTSQWNSLYEFWGDKITRALNKTGDDTIINLASQEYFRVIQKEKLELQIITPVFKELKGEKLQTIGIYAKKARGLMARFIIKNQISDPEEIKFFNENDYRFQTSLSDRRHWVFTR